MYGDTIAHAQADSQISEQQLRQEVLKLGFEKYQLLMQRAMQLARKTNKSHELTGKDREEFLNIPLLVRQKAIEQVSYENRGKLCQY